MLFDEQNSYFDTKTNEYSEAIDIDNKINNNEYFLDIDTLNVYNYRTSNKIDTLEEGFYKGNMFVNTYDKYKNHLYKVVVSGEKDKLLLIIQMHIFALNDLNLYLDLNPNDKTLIEKFNEYNSNLTKAKYEYEKKYGPLCFNSIKYENKFNWIDKPWPWEKGGNI